MRYQKATMSRRRVTVHFGSVRVVVPCPGEQATVADLEEAAVLRYRKVVGKMNGDVTIRRLELLRDGGILDRDDRLCDVFDENSDQILAIYDESDPEGKSSANSGSSFGNGTRVEPDQRLPPPYTSCRPSTSTSTSSVGPPLVGRVRDSVVEITNIESPPSKGLHVMGSRDNEEGIISASSSITGRSRGQPAHGYAYGKYSASAHGSSGEGTPVRSSIRSEVSTPTKHRVTLSPEVEKKLAIEGEKDTRFARSSARKSRINDDFLDAVDRLELNSDVMTPVSHTPAQLEMGMDHEHTVVAFPDNQQTPIGIEVSALCLDDASGSIMPSSSAKLSGLEIISIDPDGRIGRDGRIRIGDRILEIDGRPVYQMSLLRARAYLTDLQLKAKPTLTLDRPIHSFAAGSREGSQIRTESGRRPALSALQQANTRAIGTTTTVKLVKSRGGFGFTVTGRETAKGERLFYIGTVKADGIAMGHLRSGDRLLQNFLAPDFQEMVLFAQPMTPKYAPGFGMILAFAYFGVLWQYPQNINDKELSGLSQTEVVNQLKKASVGDTVSFFVSRVPEEDKNKTLGVDDSNAEAENRPPPKEKEPMNDLPKPISTHQQKAIDHDELILVIPLNDTGSAGLGVSLKARVNVGQDHRRDDCGIFIKNVMVGGAAFKDGRLRVDDRIVGIEAERVDGHSNAEATNIVKRKLKALGPGSKHVRLVVHRSIPGVRHSREDSRLTVDGSETAQLGGSALPSPARISLRGSTSSGSGTEDKHYAISDLTRLDDSELMVDPFDREAVSRKSLSEKRGLGAAADPNHIKLFQDIKHQRQTSAPPSAISSSSSFHGQGLKAGANQKPRSASVHPPQRKPVRKPEDDHPETAAQIGDRKPMRSMSVESLNRGPSGHYERASGSHPPPDHIRKKVGRGTPVSHSFRQAIDVEQEPIYASAGHAIHPYPPGSPVIIPRSGSQHTRDKQRRKSMGNTVRNFFGLKSRESSPEKAITSDHRRYASQADERRYEQPPAQMSMSSGYDRSYAESERLMTPQKLRRQPPHKIYGAPDYEHYPSPMSSSVPEYGSEFFDRYEAHKYPEAIFDYGPSERGGYYPPQSPAYPCPMPSSKSFHGDERGGGWVAADGRHASPGTLRAAAAASERARRPTPDYYHMFNSWFAYSGGGGVGAAPALKAAFGGPTIRVSGGAGGRGFPENGHRGGGGGRGPAGVAPFYSAAGKQHHPGPAVAHRGHIVYNDRLPNY